MKFRDQDDSTPDNSTPREATMGRPQEAEHWSRRRFLNELEKGLKG